MKHRFGFAGKKLIRMGLLLLGVSIVTFLLMCASPLDPLQTNVGQVALGTMSQEQVEALQSYWGMDTPPLERYLGWLTDVLRGDFGTSLLYRQPVLEVVGQRLSSSFWLLLLSWMISGVLGVFLGALAGAFRGRLPDKLVRDTAWSFPVPLLSGWRSFCFWFSRSGWGGSPLGLRYRLEWKRPR